MRRFRRLSFILILFILVTNIHAITVKAAPLDKANANKIASAIIGNSMSHSKAYSANTVLINSFEVTDLDEPVNGKLLDRTATIVADTGFSWEIPVLWVDQDGNLAQVAIEMGEVRHTFPIFVFYLPDGYNLTFGKDATFDISMPQFVCDLMASTTAVTVYNPAINVTYITPLIPGHDGFVAKKAPQEGADANGKVSNEDGASNESEDSGGGGGGDIPGPGPKPSGDYQYEDYDPDLTPEERKAIVENHCDESAISQLSVTSGERDLAWFVSFVKEQLEPEAVSLLVDRFPAFKSAVDEDKLGKSIGLYIYFDDPKDGNTRVAGVDYNSIGDEKDKNIEYRLEINAAQFFKQDETTGEYYFNGDQAYCLLDNTLVHEMMHAFMFDYTRAGMTGIQYDAEEDEFTTANKKKTLFPNWFLEGIATTVDNPYQYWNSALHKNYGYDSSNTAYSEEALKEAFLNNKEDVRLSFNNKDVNSTNSNYVSGYLANVYLGYMAAMKYDGDTAVANNESGKVEFNSSVILSGVNHILDKLNDGMTLDEIIAEISKDGDGSESIYTSADDFAAKFIVSEDGTSADGGTSLQFCTQFLNYLEGASKDGKVANGSILLDFTDTSKAILDTDLMEKAQDIYKITDSKDHEDSTVDTKKAVEGGGKSEPGTIGASTASSEDSSEDSSDEASSDVSDEAAAKVMTDDYTADDSEVTDAASEGRETDEETDSAGKESSTDDAAVESSTEATSEDSAEEESTEDASDVADTDEQVEDAADVASSEEQAEDAGNADSEDSAADEASYDVNPEVTEVVTEESDTAEMPHRFILSESEPEDNGDDTSDNSCEEQILDAITNDNSSDEESQAEEAPSGE